ncbi:nucleotidyltransferase [Psychromonas sp. Urea-02u-13]|nr:nucleotidyltransferase [Psychromonas sp. Urea-02u-13]
MRVKTTGKVLFSATKPLRAQDAVYNYASALTKLIEAQDALPSLLASGLQDIYLDLIVKRFEFTYEMSWKAIKRVLNMLGIEEVKSPRACFKEAYAQELITDQTIWLDMIEMRNLSSHTYDEHEIQQIKAKLPIYTQAFQALLSSLESQLDEA